MTTAMIERTRLSSGAIVAALLVLSACAGASSRCEDAPFDCPEEWAAWPMRGSAPARYLSDSEQVTDETTGLMWQRAALGDMYRWSQARNHCEDLKLAGHSDWRLPSRLELITLVEYERLSNSPVAVTPGTSNSLPAAAIDAAAFPNTLPAEYWTESYFHGNQTKYGDSSADLAWTVSFATGEFTGEPRELQLPRARCVRTARTATASSSASAPPANSRYTIKSQTVTERATGLTWQRATGPRATSSDAEKYCFNLTLDGVSGFRLPHLKELLTVAAATAEEEPYVDPDAFEAPTASYEGSLWSSTPGAFLQVGSNRYPSNFCVDFADRGRIGGPSNFDATKGVLSERVRCVRGAAGQP
jgi:hypothetical protein